MANWLTNIWYMAAWSHELHTDLLRRRILGVDLVLFRTSLGEAAALLDRCPHRFAPLSRGKIVGDAIQCGYHGLCFDHTGTCVKNPHGSDTELYHLQSFPIMEQDKILWVWMGDVDKADNELIPKFPVHEDTDSHCVYGKSKINANYQLITDNLLDLTHVTYLHTGFGADDYHPEHSFHEDERYIESRYFTRAFPNSPMGNALFPSLGDELVDEWDDMIWEAPATLHLEVVRSLTGEDRDKGMVNHSAHILTPETVYSSHYFWSSSVPVANPVDDDTHKALLSQAFDQEDQPMIEAIQQNMGDVIVLSDLKPLMLPGDKAAVRARLKLKKLIEDENKV